MIFYCLMLEIYRDCDLILLLVLRLVTEKNDYLKSRDDKNYAFFVIYFVIGVVGMITPTFTIGSN